MKDNEHIHTYNKEGKITCCSLEEKIDRITAPPKLYSKPEQLKTDNNHDSHEDHDHDHEDLGIWPAVISLVLLLSGLLLDHFIENSFFTGWVRVSWYVLAYIPVAYTVIREAIEALFKGEVFTEFFLMSIATIGAFAIGEYPEAVAVMLFYAVGELFQMSAVKRAKNTISALLDIRPKVARVSRDNAFIEVHPEEVEIGEIIEIRKGESVPLDGKLISALASLDTVALTGESRPEEVKQGGQIKAGSVNLGSIITVETNRQFNDSSIARILELVQNATNKKAKTELLIRKLARVYTPIVVYVAIAVCILPYFFVDDYIFSDWLYRALIFLVISCPCALVISIPLGYFGGLGAASQNGILFKGATFLDQITQIETLVLDKTGTLTEGVFTLKDIVVEQGISERDFMQLLVSIEAKSTHPIAKAILRNNSSEIVGADEVEEIAGEGIKGKVKGRTIVAGNKKLFKTFKISTPEFLEEIVESTVIVGINGKYAGYVTIADAIKPDAKAFLKNASKHGVKKIMMLSGDKDSITQKVAQELEIKIAKGGLLPEDKLEEVERLKREGYKNIAFVGDGINDAPVLAASDLGIAMGARGSDVAIETADVIIQTDEPSKIITAMNIGKATQAIIWQNIYLAFGVKIVVLILGAGGLATMWEAVFADVGVALLAILNAIRIQKKNY